MADRDSGWWNDIYPSFRPFFDTVPARVTHAEVRYFVKKLGLKPGTRFLDCPCGIGRIGLPLARKGVRVTGVDIMRSFLDEFGDKAQRRHLSVKLVHSDMRRISFDRQFDAAGNLWTSFGYFAKESDNLLVLKKMYQALKPGGKFALYVINRDWIMVNYQSRFWSKLKGGVILEERDFDYRTSTSSSVWHFDVGGKKQSFDVDIRMYSFHELVTMFESVGFVDIEGFGSINDDPISRDSRVMFVFGTRPRGK